MTKTYVEWRAERQQEIDALPIYWAFSEKQFEEVLRQTGAAGAEDFCNLGGFGGGFCLVKDLPAIKEYFCRPDELAELIKDYGWAKDAFVYEMQNHEYSINWDGDCDVINCFAKVAYKDEDTEGYLARVPWCEDTKRAYRDAKREYYRLCEENGWW